jgi:hypothetical protein
LGAFEVINLIHFAGFVVYFFMGSGSELNEMSVVVALGALKLRHKFS